MLASEHRIPHKTAKNEAFSLKKSSFKTTSGEFLGMYDLDFSCSSIFHQLWAHIRHFKGKKVQLIFHPVFALFSLPGRLPKAIITPWKCLLRVPWWNTFQWGPKKPPKPFLAKKNFQPQNPKSHSQPSVQCGFFHASSKQLKIWAIVCLELPKNHQKNTAQRAGSVI